jgi:sigma-54 dependent transcriptional regulator, acetoin dehydrogenase operon transcriptional activator AcoR
MANLEQSQEWQLAVMPGTASLSSLHARVALRNQIVQDSHERARAMGLVPTQQSDFSSQGASDFKITKERSARLYSQAVPIMDMLLEQVSDTASMVVLTDDTGTILRTCCHNTFMESAERVALRQGVSWAESSKGTNAVGTALMLESEILIHAKEHYIQSNQFLTCSAAPIFDPSGNIIGVLDVSGDKRSFHPHTLGLVKMSARMIENYWFRDSFRGKLCVHFHAQPELIGTVVEGIMALDGDGRVQGINLAGLKLLGSSSAALRILGLRGLFGLSFGEMLDRLRASRATPLRIQLPSGPVLYVRADFGESGLDQSFTVGPRTADAKRTADDVAASAWGGLMSETGAPVARAISPPQTLDELGRDDPQMRSVVDKVRRVIDKDVTILILGETGTGKELLARAIHQASVRQHQAFVAVNCASIPETLIESELFGYEEGAFTGAKRKGALGKLLQADGGTLLLDEIGDMPLALQARLLRVLQERRVTPLGSQRSIAINVNVVCATHRNLREMIAQHSFREDLYYRINGLSVKLPRLRERTDLRALCACILREVAPGHALGIDAEIMAAFEVYQWPGNLRQLHSVLRTAAIMAGTDRKITRIHLSDDFLDEIKLASEGVLPNGSLEKAPADSDEVAPMDVSAIDPLQQVKLESIRRALAACGGNVSLAAKQLNVSRNTIYRKLKSAAS